MSLLTFIRRALAARRTSTMLSALGVALGVMLVAAILLLEQQVRTNYGNQGSGFPMIVGAKGSALQLVLNTVYHVDRSPGLMPFRVYRELAGQPWVKLATPYALGDSFHGHRVVATTDAIFDPAFRPLPGHSLKIAQGRPFHSDPKAVDEAIKEIEEKAARGAKAQSQPEHHDEHGADSEAVIGSEVATHLGLKIGDRIEPTHGVEGGKEHEHEHFWKLVGILEPTGTAIDRVVYVTLESFYEIDEHQAGAVIPGTTDVGLSSVIIVPKSPIYKATMLPTLNKRLDIQVASPSEEITKLMAIVGRIDLIFLFVAGLTVVVSLLAIAVALFNTMTERRREIAVMRAIGAKKWRILIQLMGEAAVIGGLGAIVGLLLGRVLLQAAAGSVAESSGFTPVAWGWIPWSPASLSLVADPFIVLLVVLVSAVAGLLPALNGYRTDVAANLAPTS